VNGKGDKPRPASVPADEFARRWARAFGEPPIGVVEATVRHHLLDLPGPDPLTILYGDPRADKPCGVLRVRSTGSTTAPREARAASDGPAAGGRPMTCPSCTGYGYTGYNRRERPVPCRKCRGTGRITPAEPQRQTPPTASERAEFFREYNASYAALIP
jgi:hypothetical protein